MGGSAVIDKAGTLTLIAALGLCVVLAVALWWQSGTVADLEIDNARLSASVSALTAARDQARSAEVAAAALAETQRRRAVAFQMQKDNVLLKQYGGCADAAIDPDLLRDIGGVRVVPSAR